MNVFVCEQLSSLQQSSCTRARAGDLSLYAFTFHLRMGPGHSLLPSPTTKNINKINDVIAFTVIYQHVMHKEPTSRTNEAKNRFHFVAVDRLSFKLSVNLIFVFVLKRIAFGAMLVADHWHAESFSPQCVAWHCASLASRIHQIDIVLTNCSAQRHEMIKKNQLVPRHCTCCVLCTQRTCPSDW